MRKIVLTGPDGQLGKAVSEEYKGDSEADIIKVYHSEMPIEDLDSVLKKMADIRPDVIINCAAYTDVDGCEKDTHLAGRINAIGPRNLAIAAQKLDAKLIHISTDYVFGAEPYNTPCREDQKGTPTGVYGKTKLHGEQGIVATNCNCVILRTAWLYSEFGKNFVKTMVNLTATKPQLKVVFDQVGTPTYALDLAKVISVIIDDYEQETVNFNQWATYTKSGIYHYSNEGVCSWYDFTKAIAKLASHTECEIQPCHSDEFPSPVKRPAFSVLDKTKIKERFSYYIPYWLDSLEVCMKAISK